MKKVLIIVRGIPGCGKSSFAKMFPDGTLICTADDYMMEDGVYVWKAEKLYSAHKRCIEKVDMGMSMSVSKIVVANTSITAKELKPYYALAEIFGYTVFSIIVENRHGGINEHGVSEETLENMKKRFNIQL